MLTDFVQLKCVKEGSKLRVRVISPGYNHEANCQFPRAIREDGAFYQIPRSGITFAHGSAGKFFYRVKLRANSIQRIMPADSIPSATGSTITPSATPTPVWVDRVYEDESTDCCVCFSEKRSVVLVPCGHYCLCAGCSNQIQIKGGGKCPLCRQTFTLAVSRDMIQT